MKNKTRFLLTISSAGAMLGFSSGCMQEVQKTEQTDKADFKSVVFILGDDHAYTALGAYGNNIIRTPNLDKLAADGVRFTNAYSNSPISSASRQSILTGKYPHATGVTLLFTPFSDETNTTVAEHLGKHNFKTCIIGKTHFNHWIWWSLWKDQTPPDYGFDITITGKDYKEFLKKNPPKPVPDSIETWEREKSKDNVAYSKNYKVLPGARYDADSEGTYFANQAVEFIKKNKNDRFCLWLAFHEPHAPFNFPVEYRGKYDPSNMTIPKGSPEDDRWIPEIFQDLTDQEKRGIIAAYYTSTEYMDKNIGLVVDALEKQGIKDSTLIVYLGDQGYLLGEHKRFEKHTMWEESVKAPLIITGGEKFEHGKSSDALVGFVDIVPTVVEALGIETLKEAQGTSFLPLLRSKTNTHKDYVFAEFLEDNKAMVRTPKWKYIFATGKRDLGLAYATGYGASGIIHRLYNMENDPNEMHNVADEPENKEVVEKMQALMLKKFKATHPYADELPQKLTREGKLVWFCEPRDVGAEYGGKPLRVFKKEE